MESFNIEIGKELKKQLSNGYDITRISDWAYNLFITKRKGLNPQTENILRHLYIMDAGPEFVYSKEELEKMAIMLMNSNDNDDIMEFFK